MESFQVVESLAGVDPAQWNALAGAQPFVRHEFFSALIDTGCAAARSGWLPQFLLMRRAGALVGAMPLFAKSHSYGEYVFDWAWADAHERHGIGYYPKLLCAVPFTPVSGRRLLASGERDRRSLAAAALERAQQTSSLHVLFPPEDEAGVLREQGMLLRRTVQFHWRNQGYADFEAFLASLNHARRKTIRQERRRVREAGVDFRWLEGTAIERRHWEFFHRCYRTTYAAHHSSPYLNLAFFLRIGAALPQNIAMVLAERDGRPIACALFLADATTLYGRYWGAEEYVPLLHFECCYYQAIEYAIRRGLQVFEGGAQGEHKLFRGLLPVETYSAHWLAHPRFARAVEDFLRREEAGIERYVNELCEHSPFKK
ncbi:MAG: GNAT family N-acetyltransferase [Betaproteobacteria bacterium RIFCSPLOWO2_12_FULL_65_14]|nr:MAG: GNAT family N-acetyltransferase [Betaproteobacteria bacterium RIFCSPLOWO2_12_FULL_65_14]